MNTSITNFSHEEIEKLINYYPILIFGKGEKNSPQCGFTARAENIFKDLEVPYTMINILEDQNLRKEMKQFSDWPTFPQIYIHKKFIGGLDILESMYQDGSLIKILDEKN